MPISLSRRAAFALAAGGLAGLSLPALGLARPFEGTTTTRVPVSVLLALLGSTFAGTTLRLHNYGRRHGDSWHAPLASSLTLGPGLGGGTRTFSLEEFRSGSSRYYVNDINLARVSVSRVGDVFRLTLSFESTGTELKGHCVGGFFSCPVGSDDTTPDVQIGNGRVLIDLRPAAHAGSVAFGSVAVDFQGTIAAGGVCRLADGLCERLTHYKSRIATGIETGVGGMLRGPAIADRIAAALRPILASRGIGRVIWAGIVGNELVVIDRRA